MINKHRINSNMSVLGCLADGRVGPDESTTFRTHAPCRVGSVGSVSASDTVGREFASRPGHTKDHHKNGTNCLPAWHAMR